MRSIASTANGGRPRLPSGAYGAISITRSAHGTTRFISSRNSRLRVRLVDKFSPRSVCFMRHMLAGSTIHCKHIRRLIVQSILRGHNQPPALLIYFLLFAELRDRLETKRANRPPLASWSCDTTRNHEGGRCPHPLIRK
ncbi:protein of unknown function (plasmid) [Cupriavidus taiwanensis]|nr:protein of unknown function [Cupriavidus taiwanensis]SPD61562.1 protein of unknown function [Cupriavidus taiwanensis]